MEIRIPEQRVPVEAEADLLVCGGGCAGIAAAVSAARRGLKVVLVERWPSVGGMATNALVTGWHRSDREKMVIMGLVEESAVRAQKKGWIEQDPKYPYAHETHWFDPEGMRIVWQRMLDEAGVRTFCYTTAGDPFVEEGVLLGVVSDTKRGRRAFLADYLIDATGDGDVAAKSGVPFAYGRDSDGLVQGMTLMFALRDIDTNRVQAAGDRAVESVMADMRRLRDHGEFPQFNEGNTETLLRLSKNHLLWNMCPAAGNPLDEEELSRLTAESREKIVAYLDYWRRNMPGYQNALLEITGFAMGVRESRRIRGRATLTSDMVLGAAKQSDAVGHGVWMIDIHDPRGSGYTTYTDRGESNMLETGSSYHIPLGMCLNDRFGNLAVVGRCASSTHEAHSSVRVQTHCMVMGQGVGTAVALAAERGSSSGGPAAAISSVDIRKLQNALRGDGVYLEDVPRPPQSSPVRR